jgi:hypothetical protein
MEKYRAVSGHNTGKGRKQWEGGKGACQGLLLTSAYRQVTVSPALHALFKKMARNFKIVKKPMS